MTDRILDRTSLALAEGLRLSHCANAERGHPCVGTCTVRPGGIVDLECSLCGKDTAGEQPPRGELARRARAIVGAAGLDFEALTPGTQLRVVQEIQLDCCPGCGTLRLLTQSRDGGNSQICVCGSHQWGRFDGWRRVRHPAPEQPATEKEPSK